MHENNSVTDRDVSYNRLRRKRTISTAANTNQKASKRSFLSDGKMRRAECRMLIRLVILRQTTLAVKSEERLLDIHVGQPLPLNIRRHSGKSRLRSFGCCGRLAAVEFLGTARSSPLREQRAAFKTSHPTNRESREKLLTNPYQPGNVYR
jgi:hypothetical protein